MSRRPTLFLFTVLFLAGFPVRAQEGIRYDILWKNSFAGDTARIAVLKGPELSVAVQIWSEDDLDFTPDHAQYLSGPAVGGRAVQVRPVGEVLLTRPAEIDSTELFTPQVREAFGARLISRIQSVDWNVTAMDEPGSPEVPGYRTTTVRLTGEVAQSWHFVDEDTSHTETMRFTADLWIDSEFDDGGMMLGVVAANGEPWLAHLITRAGLPTGRVVRIEQQVAIDQLGSVVQYENFFTLTPPWPHAEVPAAGKPFLNLPLKESDVVLGAVVLASMLSMQPLPDSTGSFKATLSGPVEAALTGRAVFGGEEDEFALRLTPQDRDDPAYGSLIMLSFPSARPQPGAYPVADIYGIELGRIPASSFAPLTVLATTEGLIVLDRVSEGSVSVTSSSTERMEGAFRMTMSGFLLKGESQRRDFVLEGTFEAHSGWENIPRLQR